jgi:hypothetical protein
MFNMPTTRSVPSATDPSSPTSLFFMTASNRASSAYTQLRGTPEKTRNAIFVAWLAATSTPSPAVRIITRQRSTIRGE